ncbi:MAG TPA: hypothetical protein VJ723_11495, partial [Candidatus Angelobacter sp.]|nr:hypothetical protein [Candidatus Angelobacter sp.]
VVRKPAWQDLRRQNPPQLLTGRRGRSMAAGEDAELCHQFQLAGWRLRYDSRLSLHHYMTANRLSWDYARRLHYGAGESSAKLAPYQEVLCGFPKRKSDWLWQTLLAAKLVLRHPLRLLRLPLRLGEGDVMTLGTELALGQLSALLSSRGSYAKNRREVMAFAVRAHGRSWVSADMHRQIDATPRDAQS